MREHLKRFILGIESTDFEKLFDNLILIPKPKIISIPTQQFKYSLNLNTTACSKNVEDPLKLLNLLNRFLEKHTRIKISYNNQNQNIHDFYFKDDDILNESFEAYLLEISNGTLIITSKHEKGLFYGLQTLIQLIKNYIILEADRSTQTLILHERVLLPEIEIIDAPDLSIRGISQDISRGQVFTVENAKRFIDIISHYKLNFYCLYIEDMYAHPNHVNIGKNRGALTSEEIKEIDAYAKERFITLCPIFETFSHVDNILSHKKYRNLGEFPGAHCFNLIDNRVFKFIEDFVNYLSNSFSSSYFHIGCDESFDFGRFKSMDYVKKVGKSQAYLELYEKLIEIALNAGNTQVMMYDDIVVNDEYVLKQFRKDVILMHWDYSPKTYYPKVEKLLNAGYKVVLSPSMLNVQRNFPDLKNSDKNICNISKLAYEKKNNNCLGVICASWGNFRYYSLRENEIYGSILTASLSWNFKGHNRDNFRKYFGFLFYGILEKNLYRFCTAFDILGDIPSMFNKFSILSFPFFYVYFFKHPFARQDYIPSFKYFNELKRRSLNCKSEFNRLEKDILFEKEHFKNLIFAAELGKLLSEKIKVSYTVANVLKKHRLNEELKKRILNLLHHEKMHLLECRGEYQKFWLSSAKRPCLDIVLKLFDFIIQCYDEKASQIKDNIKFLDPYLPSHWIWINEKKSGKSGRYFQKDFTLTQNVKKAIVQVMACNYLRLRVNGSYVGDVSSRFSLSIIPISNRVKVFDITDKLKRGNNNIDVQVFNFEGYKGAINLFAQILLEDNSILEIASDKSWRGYIKATRYKSRTNNRQSDPAIWKKIKSYGFPPALNGDIFKPNLLKGEISYTQDYFGIQGFLYSALNIQVHKSRYYFLDYDFDTYEYNTFRKSLGKLLIGLIRPLVIVVVLKNLSVLKRLINFLVKRLKPFD